MDFQIPSGDLGAWLRPDLDSFPDRNAYLKADGERVRGLRDRYLEGGQDLLIGIAWLSKNPEIGAIDPNVAAFTAQLEIVAPETGDRLALLMDRCVDAEQHLEQMMPVPLCLAGLCDDLGRLLRGASLSRV